MVAVPSTIINHGQILANFDSKSGVFSFSPPELLASALLDFSFVAFGFFAAAFFAAATFFAVVFFPLIDLDAIAFGVIVSTYIVEFAAPGVAELFQAHSPLTNPQLNPSLASP